jgi:hypothetical protein
MRVFVAALLTIGLLLSMGLTADLASSARARSKSTKRYKKIFPHTPCTARHTWPGCVKKFHSLELRPYTAKEYEDHGLEDRMTPQGRTARGMWITPYFMHRVGAERISESFKRRHLNAVVIDTKDDHGQVLWPSKVALSKKQQRLLLRRVKQTVDTFHRHGFYVIGRLVAFKDSRLPLIRPDLSARIGIKARRLLSAGANWLDPYSMEVQDYIIDLALELQELGFDEIQFDYIRFPKGIVSRLGTWLHNKEGIDRATIISRFLERADRALRIPLSADIYGLTTLVDGDPRGLGQYIERLAKYVEAISPMMYANSMPSYFKNNTVSKFVYDLINCGLWRTRAKAPKVVLRPYLQAYSNNVEHFFGPDFIRHQLVAAQHAGSDGFLFWNPNMRNGVLYAGLRRFGYERVDAFGEDTEQWKRHRPSSWCKRRGEVFAGQPRSKKRVRKKRVRKRRVRKKR